MFINTCTRIKRDVNEKIVTMRTDLFVFIFMYKMDHGCVYIYMPRPVEDFVANRRISN